MRNGLLGAAVAAATMVFGSGSALAATLTAITPYNDPLGGSTQVSDINDAGWMTGSINRVDGSQVGFIRDPAGTYTTFSYGASTWGRSIDDANNVVAWVTDPGIPVYGISVIRAAGGGTTVVTDPNGGTPLYGIPGATLPSGVVVGDFRFFGLRRGYILDGASLTNLSVPGANLTAARGVNSAGDVVGFYADDAGVHAYLYSGGAFSFVDHPGAVDGTYFQQINDGGIAVGEWFDAADISHPFAYDTHTQTFMDLAVPGDLSLRAWGIDNHGRIAVSTDAVFGAVSYLYDPSGSAPEPQSWALMILGFGLVGASLRRVRVTYASNAM